MKVKSESEVAQSCPTLSNLMDCSLPGSSVHQIFQARVLEWGAIAFSELFLSAYIYIYMLFPQSFKKFLTPPSLLHTALILCLAAKLKRIICIFHRTHINLWNTSSLQKYHARSYSTHPQKVIDILTSTVICFA